MASQSSKKLNLQYFQPDRLTSMPMDVACLCTQKGHMAFTASGFHQYSYIVIS